MHSQAEIAAEAARAAHAQGKFFPMHKKIEENSRALSREKLIELAKEVGLDIDRFTKELDAHTHREAIQRETKEAMDIGASGTPASFVNGRYLSGAKPYASFKELVDEELKWAREGNRPAFTTAKHVSEASPRPAAAAAGPDPNRNYDIPVGNAPVIGSTTAKITILHYLDYQ
jgi:protein-disulfide isomerase